MAKKDDLGGIRLKTEPEPGAEQPRGLDPVVPRGIGLKQSDWDKFYSIAAELGMKPGILARHVLIDFIQKYLAGEIKTETTQIKKLV